MRGRRGRKKKKEWVRKREEEGERERESQRRVFNLKLDPFLSFLSLIFSHMFSFSFFLFLSSRYLDSWFISDTKFLPNLFSRRHEYVHSFSSLLPLFFPPIHTLCFSLSASHSLFKNHAISLIRTIVLREANLFCSVFLPSFPFLYIVIQFGMNYCNINLENSWKREREREEFWLHTQTFWEHDFLLFDLFQIPLSPPPLFTSPSFPFAFSFHLHLASRVIFILILSLSFSLVPQYHPILSIISTSFLSSREMTSASFIIILRLIPLHLFSFPFLSRFLSFSEWVSHPKFVILFCDFFSSLPSSSVFRDRRQKYKTHLSFSLSFLLSLSVHPYSTL